MFCPECGGKIHNGICTQCGMQFAAAQQPVAAASAPVQNAAPVQGMAMPAPAQPMPAQPQQYVQPQYAQPQQGFMPMRAPQETVKSDFISPDERSLYDLGSGYLSSLLAGGGFGKATATVTNKRVYFKGESYVAMGLGLKRCKTTQVADLKDITGISIYRYFNLGGLIFSLFVILLGVIISVATDMLALLTISSVGLIGVIAVFLSASTLMRVEHAGGFMAMDVRKFSKTACNDFRNTVFRAKDAITHY